MASASLLAFLIVSKFGDGLPLYRISKRLERLGIEISHTLMSDWLVQCAELLEELHRRMMAKVLASGHMFTDNTVLPLQNHDPTRRCTVKARLWVYARNRRRHKPLVAYEFTRTSFAVVSSCASAVKRMPGIVNFNFLPDMGRMTA
jgi:transposase